MGHHKVKKTMTVRYDCPNFDEMDYMAKHIISLVFNDIRKSKTVPLHFEYTLKSQYEAVEKALAECISMNVTGTAVGVGWFGTRIFTSYSIVQESSPVKVELNLQKYSASVIKRYLDNSPNRKFDEINFDDLCYCIALDSLMFMHPCETMRYRR